MDHDPQALLAGTEIAGYRVVRTLGAGGFGITYEGYSAITRRRVAIKEFFPHGIASRENSTRLVYAARNADIVAWALDRFERSTTELCELKHRSIVEVLHYVKDNDTGYMIMEYVDGETLEIWLQQRELAPSADEIRPVIEPILDALDLVHGTGRIHRDIAPDNIMIRSDGRPVLIDFGALKSIEQRTAVGRTFVVAKPNYSPPEQTEDAARLDRTADIYALGAVLYRAFAGFPPVDAQKTRLREVAYGRPDPYVPLAEVTAAYLSPGVFATIDRALAFRAEDRVQSIDELRSGLEWEGGGTASLDEHSRRTGVASPGRGGRDATFDRPGSPPGGPSGAHGGAGISMPRRGASGAARSKHLFADRDTSKPRPWLVYAAIGTVALIGVVLAGRQWLAIGVNSCGGAETHWRSVEAIGTQAAFEDHLARFSECQFAGLARARIATVELDRRALADEQRKRAETEARQAEQAERKSRMGQPLSPALERALKARDIFKECEACPEMIVIPAGTFTMGSPESEAGRNRDEGPQRSVTIARPLGVGRFAVTFEQWDACVADSGCTAYRPSDEGWGRGRQPVVNVSWNDARAYVAWLARKTGKIYRLLSEAEREYVTRAGTTTPFWWGNSISTSQANYDGNSAYAGGPRGEYRGRALPVESFDANPWGLHQVHGNVWEWVEDCWNESNRGAPANGAALTTGDCSRRMVRGGSWYDGPSDLRSANRFSYVAAVRISGIGFRLARTLTP